jgi:hypothetical protein
MSYKNCAGGITGFPGARNNLNSTKNMNRLSSMHSRLRSSVTLAVVAATLFAASAVVIARADTTPPAAPPADTKPVKQAEPKAVKKKLTGAELYALNCNRCHPERYATEFTSAQWKTIMLHMRVRASLPAAQAKAILKYLQEDSGN